MSEMHGYNEQIIAEFRGNGGKVGGPFEGSTLALVTTIGARTGRRTTTPLACLHDGDRYILVASDGGAPKNPAWYHNVGTNPGVTVEFGTEEFEATATIPDRPERDRLFERVVEVMPFFAEYQKQTSRVLPVVVLNRTG